MALIVEQLSVDAEDPWSLADWWAQVLGWVREPLERPVRPASGPAEDEVWIHPDGRPTGGILFVEVHDPRTVKNRLHLDLRPDDQDAEVARLKALGARRIDVGQRDVSWVVLADPEGNEFCVLSSA